MKAKKATKEKRFIHKPDFLLIIAIVFAILLGLVMLFTASSLSWISLQKTDKSTFYIAHQILWGLLPGLILGLICYKLPLNWMRKFSFLLVVIAIISLVLIVFVPSLSFEAGGASRWLKIGGLTFQASALAKLAVIFYLAALLERRFNQGKIKDFTSTMIPSVALIAIFAFLLLLQPEIGTLLIICLVVFSMLWIAEASFSHLAFLVLIGIVLLVVGSIAFPYQSERISSFLGMGEQENLDSAYQVRQSLIAVGSGGLLGKGLGEGIQKYGYLPRPMEDSIFAVWGEEMGFLGCIIVIMTFLFIGARGFIIARRAPDKFSQFLAGGIVSWILIQAFVHMGAISGLIPFTGEVLPFMSYGGSALVFNLVGMSVLVNISRKTT